MTWGSVYDKTRFPASSARSALLKKLRGWQHFRMAFPVYTRYVATEGGQNRASLATFLDHFADAGLFDLAAGRLASSADYRAKMSSLSALRISPALAWTPYLRGRRRNRVMDTRV